VQVFERLLSSLLIAMRPMFCLPVPTNRACGPCISGEFVLPILAVSLRSLLPFEYYVLGVILVLLLVRTSRGVFQPNC
jgi:hypothetical protein